MRLGSIEDSKDIQQYLRPTPEKDVAHKYPTFRSDEWLEPSPRHISEDKFDTKDNKAFDDILQYLIAKHEELEDKAIVESLILELNQINKQGYKHVPAAFLQKIDKYKQTHNSKQSLSSKPGSQLDLLKGQMNKRVSK